MYSIVISEVKIQIFNGLNCEKKKRMPAKQATCQIIIYD